jgi:23S rRNA pseudouridine2605 synthase
VIILFLLVPLLVFCIFVTSRWSRSMRINKFLSQAGEASRRGAEDFVRQGRVTVNGEIVRDLGRQVDPVKDAVKVDGKRVFMEEFRYYLFHKPDGMVTTMEDPQGRPSLKEVVSHLPCRVVPVGRLDYHTQGFLLLTNDGELAQQFLHPRFEVPRVYEAKVNGILKPETFDRLRTGVRLEDGWATADVRPSRRMESNSYLFITVKEGRKHLVRRILSAVGHEVIRLLRVSFGPLQLGGLAVGQWRPLSLEEVKKLKQWAQSNARRITTGSGKKTAQKGSAHSAKRPSTLRRPRKGPSKGSSASKSR